MSLTAGRTRLRAATLALLGEQHRLPGFWRGRHRPAQPRIPLATFRQRAQFGWASESYCSAPPDTNLWQNRQNRQRKDILRRFTTLVAALGLAVATGVTVVYLRSIASADRTDAAVPETTAERAAPTDRLARRGEPTAGGRGQRLVEQALATLNRRINVRANVRQETVVGGRRIQGTGAYWQQGAGDQRRTRWEVATQISDEKASFLQVFDSNELWNDRQLPSSRDVSRVHLVRLRRELSTSDFFPAPGPDAVGRCAVLAGGGLAALLAELVENFHFDDPTRGEISRQPALAVIGVWKPAALHQISPRQAPAAGPIICLITCCWFWGRLICFRI